MNNWIFTTVGVGVVVLIISIIFFVKDSHVMSQSQKKASFLLPNLSLALLSFLWIGLAVYLYMDVQTQVNYFLKQKKTESA